MHTYEPFEECSGVVASVRNEIMADIFNALVKAFKDALEFSKKVCQYLPGDIEGRGRSELMNGDMGEGDLKTAIFAMTSFLNEWCYFIAVPWVLFHCGRFKISIREIKCFVNTNPK